MAEHYTLLYEVFAFIYTRKKDERETTEEAKENIVNGM